jgi:hypothetical protein
MTPGANSRRKERLPKALTAREVLVELQRKVGSISDDFKKHVEVEDPQLKEIVDSVKKIEGQLTSLNTIRLNGDERVYTIEGALQLLYGVVKEEKIKKDLLSNWKQVRDGSAWLHFVFATRAGKLIQIAFWLYVFFSILDDLSIVHILPLKLLVYILKPMLTRIF